MLTLRGSLNNGSKSFVPWRDSALHGKNRQIVGGGCLQLLVEGRNLKQELSSISWAGESSLRDPAV